MKNYVYGQSRDPEPQHAEAALEQMRAAHRYRNTLVELELARRSAVEAALRERYPRLAALDAEIAAAEAAAAEVMRRIKAANAQERRRRVGDGAKEELATIKASKKLLYAERKALRADAFADTSLAAIEEQHKARHKAARAACGVYWGSYLRIEQAAEKFREGAPPRFLRFDGSGACGVQLQGGLLWDDLLAGTDTRARLIARGGKDYDLWYRIGTHEGGREPIWCVLPLCLHRHPEPGARVKELAVFRRVIGSESLTSDGRRWVHGGRVEWSAMFTCDEPARKTPSRGGMVGIDVGWRMMPDGSMRVAYYYGEHGEGDLRIPAADLVAVSKAQSIQGFRDRDFAACVAGVLAWKQSGVTLPEWFVERTTTLHAWRSKAALAALAVEWATQPIDGDDAPWCGTDCWGPHESTRLGGWPCVREAVLAWRRRDGHLARYAQGLLDGFAARRKDRYRNFAAQLAAIYDSCAIEKIDLRETIARPAADEADKTCDAMRHNQGLAAVSTLLTYLREKMDAVKVAAEHTTTDCHACGQRCEWDSATELRHTCEHCGAEWDQDANAARNILARGAAVKKDQQLLAAQSSERVALNSAAAKKPSRKERFATARKKKSGAVA